MNKICLICLFCCTAANCFAIEYYKSGDTLWVWAKNGLNIREKPDAHAKVLGKIDNGSQVVILNDRAWNSPYSLEEIKSISSVNTEIKERFLPNFELTGYWAKIKYKGISGFVFDAYLSRLPTMIGDQYDKQSEDDFHALALKKHAKILKQVGQNKYDQYDNKFVRYIFDKGYIIDVSGGSGNWGKEMLFPDGLSLIERYLIYSHTMKGKEDKLIEKGKDCLIFQVDTGTLTIKKAGSFLVIYEEHHC